MWCDRPGSEDVLELRELPAPAPGPGQIRIQVAATAVNRADLLQRQGRYPPPPGESTVLGLECAGVVESAGPGAARFAPGDRVMALLAGGGYAEQVVCDERVAMPVPAPLTLLEAAAVPEAWLTAWLALFRLARLEPGQTMLIHGGGSGVGTAALQLAGARGVVALCTVGSEAKAARCRDLGAGAAIDYRREQFAERALELTSARGVDAVIDTVGGPYLEANLRALRRGGRLVCLGLLGGARADLDLGLLLRRHLTVIGSTLRSRPLDEKAELCAAFEREVLPLFATGAVRPVIDRVVPLAEAAEAHRVMHASLHFGKIVLRVGEPA